MPKERQYLELSGKDKIKMTMLHMFMVADFESVPCSYLLIMELDYPQLCKFCVFIGHTPDETIADFCETILAWSKVYFFCKTFIPNGETVM